MVNSACPHSFAAVTDVLAITMHIDVLDCDGGDGIGIGDVGKAREYPSRSSILDGGESVRVPFPCVLLVMRKSVRVPFQEFYS